MIDWVGRAAAATCVCRVSFQEEKHTFSTRIQDVLNIHNLSKEV
jgi:hypothetical protein